MVLLVFSHQQSPCTWSLPCFMSRTHFKKSVGEYSRFPKLLQVKVLNLSNQNQNSKPRHVWRKKVTSPLKASSQESSSSEQTEVLMNFRRRSPVRRTYNTEPSPKELAWERSTSVYPGKYSFPFFSFTFFFIVKKMMNETK